MPVISQGVMTNSRCSLEECLQPVFDTEIQRRRLLEYRAKAKKPHGYRFHHRASPHPSFDLLLLIRSHVTISPVSGTVCLVSGSRKF
ncbi:MAG TPA: hypothetical protein PKJ23_14340 [bacterium]|nr:hypothetical protein [bacterium]